MAVPLFQDSSYLRAIFDAIPSPSFVMDDDVRVLDANRAALPFLGNRPGRKLIQRGGDLLQCVQAVRSPGGCGSADFCKHCTIRNSVKAAAAGHESVRRRVDMQLVTNGETNDTNLLITASPFEHDGNRYTLLILEDITELAQLRRMLPICAHCKKIRNDEQYWEQVEVYLSKHTDLQFTHGLCPDCIRLLYPSLVQDDPGWP